MYTNRKGFSIFPSMRATMILGQYGFSSLCLPEEALRCEQYATPKISPFEESMRFGKDGFSSFYYGRQKWI